MSSRFSVWPVLWGHWKGLTDGSTNEYRPDWPTRIIFAAVPSALVAFMQWRDATTLASPGALLAGVSLLASGLLGAFTNISGMRQRVVDRAGFDLDVMRTEREMLDESAAHLLLGSLLCVLDAVLLLAGMNAGTRADGAIIGVWACAVAWVSCYIVLLFAMTVPRLYLAYVQTFRVEPRMDGFVKGHR